MRNRQRNCKLEIEHQISERNCKSVVLLSLLQTRLTGRVGSSLQPTACSAIQWRTASRFRFRSAQLAPGPASATCPRRTPGSPRASSLMRLCLCTAAGSASAGWTPTCLCRRRACRASSQQAAPSACIVWRKCLPPASIQSLIAPNKPNPLTHLLHTRTDHRRALVAGQHWAQRKPHCHRCRVRDI